MDISHKASVLIVEEHPVTRWGLRHFLETRKNVVVIGEAGSVAEARVEIRRLDPDVVILDIALSDGAGMAFTKEILKEKRRNIIAFSASDTWDSVQKFIKAGGLGFVTKRCSPDELIQAIDAVAHGHQWISPSLKTSSEITAIDHKHTDSALSPRERQVVALVARGLTSRQIAEQLCVGLKTVETHRYRIFRELQITSRSQLVNYAIQNGMLDNSAR